MMSQDDLLHTALTNPLKSDLCVICGGETLLENSFPFQLLRSHKMKMAKGGITKSESLRQSFAEHADHGVDVFQIVVINLFQFCGKIFIAACHFRPTVRRRQAQLATKLIVTRHATLPISKNINRRKV